MKTIKFPRGCEMTLYIPLVVLSAGGREGVDAEQLTDVSVGVSLHKERVALTPTLFENFLSVVLPATLKAGSYVIDYGFKYMGRPVAGVLADRLDIVADNAQSNWQGFVSDGKAYLSDQIFIAGPLLTDEEINRLKAEYEAAIVALNAAEAAALAAKEEFDRKAENIESLGDMAKESTLNAGVNAIRQDISQIHVDVPDNIATKSDVDAVTDHLDNYTDLQISRTQDAIGNLSDKVSETVGRDADGVTLHQKADSFAQELDTIKNLVGYTINEIDGL